jgi:predicted ABC-type sugar transport system permease subunit
MDGYWLAEVGGAALACVLAAAVTFQVVGGSVNVPVVAGIGTTAAIAAAANRQARHRHAAAVADEAPTDGDD